MSQAEENQRVSDVEQDAAERSSSLLGSVRSGVWKLATTAPRTALKMARKGAEHAERVALRNLRERMDALDDTAFDRRPRQQHQPAFDRRPASLHDARGRQEHPQQIMAQLLEVADDQSQADAQNRLALRIVRQLVPDEVRILAALSDGHHSTLLHLGAGKRVGPIIQRWVENMSSVGRESGVSLPDQTQEYVTNLRALGLLESGEEDKSMDMKYQLMEADPRIRQSSLEIEKLGLRPRLVRRTLRMSAYGKQFWASCQPDAHDE
ncbi:MAG: Abi-alpha family protein [Panacagrimonas sp.]